MSILRRRLGVAALLATLTFCGGALAESNVSLQREVLQAYVSGGYYMELLEGMRSRSPDFPALVAGLTDYDIWQHEMLAELTLKEGGKLLIPALEAKLHTDITCLPEFAKICQPTLADRNSPILSALWYFEHPP